MHQNWKKELTKLSQIELLSKMSWGFQQTRPEVRGWTSYCRYLITENVWSNFIINSTSLSLSLDPTLSCYRHPLTATIVATGLLALHCYGVFFRVMRHRTLISRTLFSKPKEHLFFRGPLFLGLWFPRHLFRRRLLILEFE